MGDEATYEIKLENISNRPVTIPWSDGSEKVKPDENRAPANYVSAIIGLTFTHDGLGDQFFEGKLIHGSPIVSNSLKRIDPKRSVRIRLRTRLTPDVAGNVPSLIERLPLQLQLRADYQPLEGGNFGCIKSVNAITIDLQKWQE